MELKIGQQVFLEKHEMFPGHPRNQKTTPHTTLNMDGPSFVHRGEITGIDEDGKGTVKIVAKMDRKGNEVPFKPEIPGYHDVFHFDANDEEQSFYTDKDKCQAYCDERNKVQLACNWTHNRPNSTEMNEMLDAFVEQMKADEEQDFAKAIADISTDGPSLKK